MKVKLIDSIQKDQLMIDTLTSVRDLNLPDCWIGAGFVRNKAWDLLHEYTERTPLSDIDVIFFDPSRNSIEFEKEIELKLKNTNSNLKWEVINQARTHNWHNRRPYKNSEDAISEWVETATCIAARINDEDQIEFIAPHGFEDIENLILRPVPTLQEIDVFNNRVRSKNWLDLWPKLKIIT